MLTNSQSPAAVLEVLMGDLHNRPESVKLPMALAVASVEGHPFHDQAFNLLTLFLDQDHGKDWAAWQQAIETRLTAAAAQEDPAPAPEP